MGELTMAKKETEQKELTPEEKEKLKKQQEKEERSQLTLIVFSGSVIFLLVGFVLALGWNSIATIAGITLIAFSIIQFIWVLAHKNLSSIEKTILIVINFIPYCIFTILSHF